jgi:hypothetical protein
VLTTTAASSCLLPCCAHCEPSCWNPVGSAAQLRRRTRPCHWTSMTAWQHTSVHLLLYAERADSSARGQTTTAARRAAGARRRQGTGCRLCAFWRQRPASAVRRPLQPRWAGAALRHHTVQLQILHNAIACRDHAKRKMSMGIRCNRDKFTALHRHMW